MSKIYVEMTDEQYENYKKMCCGEIDDETLYDLIMIKARKNNLLKTVKQDFFDPLSNPVYMADFAIQKNNHKGEIRCIIKEEKMLEYE